MENRKLIFVSRSNFLNTPIPGGVQICTQEFYQGFSEAGFMVIPFALKIKNSLWTRLKVRLGVDIYSEGEVHKFAQRLIRFIEDTKAEYVALNMTHLIPLAKALKKHFGNQIKVILLSHGNESGDFLYEVVNNLEKKSLITRVKQTYRLGGQIVQESFHRQYIDHVFVISEVEKEIENWLGTKSVTFIPRILKPDFLDWKPNVNYVGYVGTLDHMPNQIGLEQILLEFEKNQMKHIRLRIVGGPKNFILKKFSKYSNVDYLGSLPNDQLRKEAQNWAVFIHPVFWYARGASTKLAQAISWGIPIITTTSGTRGYVWRDGNVVLKETAHEMVQEISRVTQSPASLKRMADEVRKISQSGPDLKQVSQKLLSRVVA